MSCITMISTLNVIIVLHSVLASRILFSLQADREQSVIPTYLSTNAPEMQSIPDGFQAWYEGRETFTGAGQPDQA
ncbi:uncharacterized protein HD556DRAFT_928045 [Suillus plorans]|uniref:Uncharacterized protein n=1 Tax=Suillus plorans TaxID=116603 RepID=A0A9P7DD33_9AGAM|nr:uncharacterized protein HD556DRAFT_928045 [Suillus plorans]KAG1787946.1 hypothetical protein HD556DRAFT_928045 [Suillus plorans]